MSQFLYGSNVAVNQVRLHYLRYGGKGHPLVLIPGITSPAITWGFVAEKLAQFFDVYVLDIRGRGLSSSGEHLQYDTDTCAQDILDFVKNWTWHLIIWLGTRWARVLRFVVLRLSPKV